MSKAQPHHLVAGLQGGYIPNLVEHYATKSEALEALRDFMDRAVEWDELRVGSLRDGYYEFSRSAFVAGFNEYAEIEPCTDSECEVDEEWQ